MVVDVQFGEAVLLCEISSQCPRTPREDHRAVPPVFSEHVQMPEGQG